MIYYTANTLCTMHLHCISVNLHDINVNLHLHSVKFDEYRLLYIDFILPKCNFTLVFHYNSAHLH